jgi:hypothetical protein
MKHKLLACCMTVVLIALTLGIAESANGGRPRKNAAETSTDDTPTSQPVHKHRHHRRRHKHRHHKHPTTQASDT